MTTKLTEDDVTTDLSGARVESVEDQLIRLRCVVVGAYPPADVTVYVGQSDITFQFQPETRITWFDDGDNGLVGLRRLTSVVSLTATTFRADHTHDGTQVRCVAKTTGMTASVEANVTLDVHCEYSESCC